MSDELPSSPPAGAPASGDLQPSSGTSSAGDTAAVIREVMAASEGTPPDAPAPSSPSQGTPTEAARGPGEASQTPQPPVAEAPDHRIQAAVRNARDKARQEAEAEFRERYGWADQLNREQVSQALSLFNWLASDPTGFAAFIQQQATAQQPKPYTPPEPKLKLDDGTALYSADQVQELILHQQRALRREIEETYGPVRDEALLSKLTLQGQQHASAMLTRCRAEWPLFTDLEPAIKKLMMADKSISLHDAYIRVYAQDGLPKQREAWDAERTGQVSRKAAASTLQPSAARPMTPRPDAQKTSREIIAEEWSRASAGA